MKRIFSLGLAGCLVSSLGFAANEHDIIGGEEVSKTEWSAHVQLDANGARCSGVAIGPRVVLTAAHCVKNGEGQIQTHNALYAADCTRHPLYPEKDFDLALCRSKEVMVDIVAENISLSVPSEGDQVNLFGYGCTQSGGSGGNDGILRMGKGVVETSSLQDVYVKGAAACFGDSGGGAILGLDTGNPFVFGVLSKGNIRDTTWVAPLGLAENARFISAWINNNPDAKICGAPHGATKEQCRVEGTPPSMPQSCEALSAVKYSHFNQFKRCLFSPNHPSAEVCAELKALVDQCYDERTN